MTTNFIFTLIQEVRFNNYSEEKMKRFRTTNENALHLIF